MEPNKCTRNQISNFMGTKKVGSNIIIKFFLINVIITTISKFMVLLRTKIELKPEEAIFLFVKDTDTGADIMLQSSVTMELLYTQYKDKEHLLNIFFEKEAVFG